MAFRSRFQFPRSELARTRALLEQVKGKPYLTFPLRRLHDYLAQEGRTSASTFERVQDDMGSTYACK